MITSVEGGIVTFSGAETSMQYNYTTSTSTNAAMLVKVSLTEVEQTPEGRVNSPPDDNGGTGIEVAGERNTPPTANPTPAVSTAAAANKGTTGGQGPQRIVLARAWNTFWSRSGWMNNSREKSSSFWVNIPTCRRHG